MIERYRRKPVEVEAVHYTEADAALIKDRTIDTFHGHRAHEVTDEDGCVYRTGKLWVEVNPSGDSELCRPGWWIVREGDLQRVVHPAIFESLYDPVPGDPSPRRAP